MLQLSNLCKGYVDGGEFHPVLQGTELTLNRGEQLALMGESGSGKSTLLNLIAGLDKADSGEIWFPNFPMHKASEHNRAAFRRHYIGHVFQQFNLLPTLNLADNIRFCRQLRGLPEDPGLWRQIMSALDLMSLLGRYPEEVSGGQQQRAAIARA
ncbi:ABC transporter ATP-binding protein, partial [Vibrio sp.]|nr:ABC transporter ATP-binding protein [Vibrio sp.]